MASLLATCVGCNRNSIDSHSEHAKAAADATFEGQHPIQVVCTTGPIADMLQNVGGEHLDVTGLMGPGVDPHLYRAAPADVENLRKADLIVYNGMHLEGRMADIFKNLASKQPVIAVTEGLIADNDVRLHNPPDFEGYFDPHVWHDPQLWSECVKYVCDRLQRFDPTHADDYAHRADEYLRELEVSDEYARSQISKIPAEQRVLVTAHDAFGYFSKAYGMESEALKGVSTDEEVSIGRMDDVIDLLVKQRIPAVFVESSVAPRIVKALVDPCAERGHKVAVGGELYADALGPRGSGADTYLGMFRANVDTIVGALAGDREQ